MVKGAKSEVQSILFRKDGIYDTAKKRNEWLKEHDLKLMKGKQVDETDKYWRYRITAPKANYSKSIQRFSKNVDAIIQYPKTTQQKKKELIQRQSEQDILESQLQKRRDEAILRLQREKAEKIKMMEDRDLVRQFKLYQDLIKETKAKQRTVISPTGEVISTIVPEGIN
jgi:hypothetical protein